ncbi:MAG: NgoFVII family restriction endonuclease [Deltaproteobacteria bacterium]|nr:NgoFVII family restriction endonuclease [Deltaproteobacteria bacterium]
MLFDQNLEEIIFQRHQICQADELIILSGYVGPNPISRLRELPFDSKVIYGMYGDRGIQETLHSSLISLQNKIPQIDIFYSKIPVHSKCYVWKNLNSINYALIGSANFSTNGLSTPYREVLAETTIDTFQPLSDYIDRVMRNSVICTDIELSITRSRVPEVVLSSQVSKECCKMSFLDRSGRVATASGLNWGQGQGHVAPNDAYIAIKKEYLSLYPKLFPLKQDFTTMINVGGRQNRHNDIVEIIWDDGKIMNGLLEGNQDENGLKYPKQISSFPKKSFMGEYLRNRLGVQAGQMVTINDLKRYGRTDVDVSLLEEGVYKFDFSKNT